MASSTQNAVPSDPTKKEHADFDLYATEDRAGDLVKAKSALARCGHPDGFTVALATIGVAAPAIIGSAAALRRAVTIRRST